MRLDIPIGASGARVLTTLLYEMQRRDAKAMTAVNALETQGGKRAVVTMCIGVGQGIAALIERV